MLLLAFCADHERSAQGPAGAAENNLNQLQQCIQDVDGAEARKITDFLDALQQHHVHACMSDASTSLGGFSLEAVQHMAAGYHRMTSVWGKVWRTCLVTSNPTQNPCIPI
jgi:hypothetical protein